MLSILYLPFKDRPDSNSGSNRPFSQHLMEGRLSPQSVMLNQDILVKMRGIGNLL